MEPCPFLNARRDPCPTREPGDMFCAKCGKEYEPELDGSGLAQTDAIIPATAVVVAGADKVDAPPAVIVALTPIPAVAPPVEAAVVLKFVDNVQHYVAPKCVGCGAPSSNFDEDGFCTKCWVQTVLPKRDDFFIEVAPNVVARSNLGNPAIGHSRNEDFAAMDAVEVNGKTVTWMVVADGVSSSKNPQQASEEACKAASAFLRAQALLGVKGSEGLAFEAINIAQEAVLKVKPELDADSSYVPPACTIVLAYIEDGVAFYGWCGDSRFYAIYKDATALCGFNDKLLSRDHTLLNEMIDETGISPAEAYKKFTTKQLHTMTQCLGEVPEGEIYAPSTATVTIGPDLVSLLACSDGAWNDVHDMALPQSGEYAKMFADMVSSKGTALSFCEAILKRASGADNTTVAVVNF